MQLNSLHAAIRESHPNLAGQSANRVLIVDDEEMLREAVRLKLQKYGYCCEGVGSVEEAQSKLQNTAFDAVLCDLWMPGRTGLELAQHMSQLYPYLPIVLMTGTGEVRTAVQSMHAGVDDFLQKPVGDEQLILSLQRALERRMMRRQLDQYQAHLEMEVNARTTELQVALSELQKTWDATLEALGSALDYRDHESLDHSKRVAEFSLALSQSLGISGSMLKCVYQGAYLHDIGKIAIPDSILLKPGRLTPDELAIMQSHVEIGYQMIKPIPFLTCAADIILAHHEKFDGSGYPNGLRGEEIPIGARIFAVADAFDAMTSHRPYRTARSAEAAAEEIQRCSGTHFDPVVAQAFLQLPLSSLCPPM
jgi:putative nucleotidyltransferase with HDIG domain